MESPAVGAEVKDVLAALRAAQKSNRGAPAYSRFINRPLGRVLAAITFKLGLSPNQVTGLSALSTFSGIGLLALAEPSVGVTVSVGLFLILGYGLDSADGQLARLRGGGTQAGEWLDHMADCAKHATIHLSILLSLYRFGGLESEALLLIPITYSALDSILFFGFILTDRIRKPHKPALAVDETARPSVLRSLLAAPTDYGLLCLIIFALPFPSVFVPLYGLLMLGTAGYLTMALPKWYADIKTVAT